MVGVLGILRQAFKHNTLRSAGIIDHALYYHYFVDNLFQRLTLAETQTGSGTSGFARNCRRFQGFSSDVPATTL